MKPHEIERKLDRVLLQVEKPGRYVGGEYNSVVKDWNEIDVKVARDPTIELHRSE